jgi:hypothetical protein
VKKRTLQLLIPICLALVTRSYYYQCIYKKNRFSDVLNLGFMPAVVYVYYRMIYSPGHEIILIHVFCKPSKQEQVRHSLTPGFCNKDALIPTVIQKNSLGVDIFSTHLRTYFIAKFIYMYINLLCTITNLVLLIYSSTD